MALPAADKEPSAWIRQAGPGLLHPPPPHLQSALPPPDCPLLCDESQEWGGNTGWGHGSRPWLLILGLIWK